MDVWVIAAKWNYNHKMIHTRILKCQEDKIRDVAKKADEVRCHIGKYDISYYFKVPSSNMVMGLEFPPEDAFHSRSKAQRTLIGRIFTI